MLTAAQHYRPVTSTVHPTSSVHRSTLSASVKARTITTVYGRFISLALRDSLFGARTTLSAFWWWGSGNGREVRPAGGREGDPMKSGDMVVWQYWHTLNAWSHVRRSKRGSFVCRARHTRKHWQKDGARQMAWVHFEGNKRQSLVPLHELRLAEKE